MRILSGYFTVPPARRHPCGGGVCIDRNVSTADHKALARKLSAMSTVGTRRTRTYWGSKGYSGVIIRIARSAPKFVVVGHS